MQVSGGVGLAAADPGPAHLSHLAGPFSREKRPWGCWTVLEEGEGYKIKRLEDFPERRISLQMHSHRSEHWVVVSGTARVTLGDRTAVVHRQESTFVAAGTGHRIENPGPILWSSSRSRMVNILILARMISLGSRTTTDGRAPAAMRAMERGPNE